MYISVIIPTYNPSTVRLKQTLESLKNQTLGYQFWELIIIDNNSSAPFLDNINLKWHPHFKFVFEPQQGLTFARIKGFQEAIGDIIIMVDDDNILDKNYLFNSLDIFKDHLILGAIGGKSFPIFESNPPKWLYNFHSSLALRDLGDKTIIESWENKYPENAPIGAGMAIRKKALRSYIDKIKTRKTIIADRTGNSLCSGGDNDIVLEIIKSGWQTGYFPSLLLYHLISKERFSVKYLSRLLNNSSKSWINLLESHNISPWSKISSWTLPLRKLKAWFIYKAWYNNANYIRWRGACGIFDGLSEKSKLK